MVEKEWLFFLPPPLLAFEFNSVPELKRPLGAGFFLFLLPTVLPFLFAIFVRSLQTFGNQAIVVVLLRSIAGA